MTWLLHWSVFDGSLCLQVRGKICAYLHQEQSCRGKLDKPRAFSLLCVMADQTLFSIVEWARSCVFFKELKVQIRDKSIIPINVLSNKSKSILEKVCYFVAESRISVKDNAGDAEEFRCSRQAALKLRLHLNVSIFVVAWLISASKRQSQGILARSKGFDWLLMEF